MRYLTIAILGVAYTTGNPQIQAQQLGLEYDTELQTNFKGDYNWVNLLRLNGSINVSESVAIEASTISIARTAPAPLIEDLQGYSNIDEENLALGIAVLGAELKRGKSTFFVGIRNVNEDYFTSPVTSLFVNSSCGIFPTLSANYDIANYPLSSWCVHYRGELDTLTLQASIYEGLGHRRIAGHDNIFRFKPKEDGIFAISSADYDRDGSNYSAGCAVYFDKRRNDIFESETQGDSPKKVSVTPWVNIEQQLNDDCSIMFQSSYSSSDFDCRYYFGFGASYTMGKAEIGLFADYAKYKEQSEIASELTCQIHLTDAISIQPTVEVIRTGSRTNVIGIGRLSIRL